MAWSPRQLGELADTSRRTVRHYQELGLLPEPERQSNGYRQYGVAHLIRLLRIRRLTQLGLTLPQIASLGGADEHPAQHLRVLDGELAARIEHLQETRRELATMLERAAPTDLPLEIGSMSAGLPPAERAFLAVLSRVLEPAGLQAYVDLLGHYRLHPAVIAFDDLADTSGEPIRRDVATGIAQHLRHLSTEHADTVDRVHTGMSARPRRHVPARRLVVNAAINDLYNSAQLEVLAIARRQVAPDLPVMVRAV